MLDDARLERSAAALANAYLTRVPLDGHEALGGDAPTTVAEGYLVQQRLRELAGHQAGGWKVGATSEVAQQVLKVDAPFLGRPSADRILVSGEAPASIVVADWFSGAPAIEVEVGLRLTRTLNGLPDDPLDLADCVEVAACIEIVDCRYGSMVGRPAPCLVADNGLASALIVSEPLQLSADEIRSFGSTPVSLTIDGEQTAEATAAMALGHPLNALHTAATIALELGTPMAAGEIVTTGTCTGLTPVAADTTALGRVGEATASVTFA